MDKVTLGKTGLGVSRLGMGGAGFSSSRMTPEVAEATLRRAVDLGVTYLDTAPSYSDSEAVLGPAIAAVGESLIISTKLGGKPQPFDAKDIDILRASLDSSRNLLGRDVIDMLLIHEPDRSRQHDWWTDYDRAEGPVMDFLAEMKEQGIVRFIGLGGTTAYALARLIRTGKFDVVLTAFNYSLLWREAAIEVLPAAREQGMGVIMGSPLQQGCLAKRYDDEVADGAPWLSSPRREQFKALYALLDETGMPIVEMAQRFVISNPDMHCVLSGARNPEEVEGNVAAIEKGRLPADLLARLDEIAARVPFRPFEEPFLMPFSAGYRGHGSVTI